MLGENKYKKFIIENKWIIIASIFFIVWKFFLINLYMENVIDFTIYDDAQVYIQHIESINKCSYGIICKDFLTSLSNNFGFEHLFYRLFLGGIAKLLNLSSQAAFIWGFYIGTILLIPVLITFLKKLTTNSSLIAFSLLFLALFNGLGSTHGFFWVVPSFYALLVFILILSIILDNNNKWRAKLFFLIPIAIYTHTIALYFLLILPVFYVIYSAMIKKVDKLLGKKIIFSLFVATIFYLTISSYAGGNPYGLALFGSDAIKTLLGNPTSSVPISEEIKENTFLPGLEQVQKGYFDWIFYNELGILSLITIILILIQYREHKILSLYFATIISVIFASVNVFANRILLLLWPLTFIIYAFGTWHAFSFVKSLKEKASSIILTYTLSISVALFIAINMIYSYTFNRGLDIKIKEFIFNFIF